jgi:hypothetical protein
VPTFCRHNRFLERCPICSQTLPGATPERALRSPRKPRAKPRPQGSASGTRAARSEQMRVRHAERAAADGYECALVRGLHASADAERLAEEIAFAGARLLLLREQPPDVYGEVRALADADADAAARACFMIAYISPREGVDPFAPLRAAIAAPEQAFADDASLELGPRSSHERARGAQTLYAFDRMLAQGGGARRVVTGDASWSPERRFERLFERLGLPGLARVARYELLLLLQALCAYELRADSLHLGGSLGAGTNDATMLACKRVFAIGDAINIERRAAALASELDAEICVLDLALWNFSAPQRATLGFPPDARDQALHDRARSALAL